MLRIYQVSLDVVAKVRGVVDAIGEFALATGPADAGHIETPASPTEPT